MMLHAVCCGEEAGARNRVFFRVKWLQPAMKATSSVRRLRLGSFGFPSMEAGARNRVLQQCLFLVCVVLCVS